MNEMTSLDRRIAAVRARSRRAPEVEGEIPEDKLRELAADTDFSVADAADVFCVSSGVVRDRCARFGIRWIGKRIPIDEARLREYARDPRVSADLAGRLLGVSATTVANRWSEMSEGPWVGSTGKRRRLPIDPIWLRERAQDPTVSAVAAAAEMFCSSRTILNRWAEMGEGPWVYERRRQISEAWLRAQAADPAISADAAARSIGVSVPTIAKRWAAVKGPGDRWITKRSR